MSKEKSFVWPTPPYYQYANAQDGNLPLGCVLFSNDGRQMPGRLIGFLPEQAVLDFAATGSTSVQTLEFARIKKLQLLRPVQSCRDNSRRCRKQASRRRLARRC